MFALSMDMDGLRGIDLVLGSKGSGGSISWLESPENPRDLSAWKLHKLRASSWLMTIRTEDMDNDGDLDILASDRKVRTPKCSGLKTLGPKLIATRSHG